MRAGFAISIDGFHALPDELSASFKRIINGQRDHELIVFGLPKVPLENCTETITKVSSFLDVSVSSSEIVGLQDSCQGLVLVSTLLNL